MPTAALAAALLAWTSGLGAETVRWVDGEGIVHYADKLPPEDAARPRAKLSAEAKVKEVIEGQRTAEQMEQLRLLKKLRAEQQRILAEQRDNDLSLQRTYHSEAEMLVALQGKLNTADSAVKVADSNRQHQEEILESLLKRAAEIELAGDAVPRNLRDSIDSTRRQIGMYQEKIRVLEKTKLEIAAGFTKDIQRFKRLDELRVNPEFGSLEWRTQSPSADVGVLSAVGCRLDECEKAWQLARDYIRIRNGKSLVTETDAVLQTAGPREEHDLALLVVRIKGKTQDTLFLDTSCHLSSIGDELCSSDDVRVVRAGFVPFIEQGLKSAGL